MQREDISLKFHHYRSLCIKNSRTTTFTIEDHFNELLSMSGILVLQKRYDYQSLPINIFPPTLLQAMRSNVISKYRRDTFNLQISSRLKTIIQRYIDEEMEERRAKIELLTLSEEATEDERGVINAIVALLSYIYDCDMKPLSEAHLAASYIHPFVHGFFPQKSQQKSHIVQILWSMKITTPTTVPITRLIYTGKDTNTSTQMHMEKSNHMPICRQHCLSMTSTGLQFFAKMRLTDST